MGVGIFMDLFIDFNAASAAENMRVSYEHVSTR